MSPDNDAPIDGDGLKRFKKGRKESKERMARIRGLRKGLGIVRSAEQVRDKVPSTIKPVKGSQAMRDKMAKLRGLRKKKGAGCFDDLSSAFIHKGLPTLDHISGEVLAGPVGGLAGDRLGNMARDAIGKATGRGLTNYTHNPYGRLINGVPRPVSKNGFKSTQHSKSGLHIHRGSFLAICK